MVTLAMAANLGHVQVHRQREMLVWGEQENRAIHKEGPMALRIGESGSGFCKAGLLLYLGSVGFQHPSLEHI